MKILRLRFDNFRSMNIRKQTVGEGVGRLARTRCTRTTANVKRCEGFGGTREIGRGDSCIYLWTSIE
eukprot:1379829-Amorphochlora_amoeboformis.AAC.1